MKPLSPVSFRRLALPGIVACPIVVCSSCSKKSGGRINPPNYNSNAGSAAIDAYDTNRDGVISGSEFDRVPGLLASLRQVDSNDDKSISADEIDARIKNWLESRIGESPVRCSVTFDGTPLEDAVVLFEPEAFLGSNVHPASGTTGDAGVAGMSMVKEHLADPTFGGVANGWYKIRVTSGTKSIPAIYNTETTPGCEVAMDAHWVGASEIVIALKSQSTK